MQVYYPYIAFRVSRPLQVAVTETLVWRLVEMVERLNLGALAAGEDSSSVAASSDSPVRISLVNMSDLAAFVSFRGDTLSRPRWAAAMGTLSWGLDMANFEAVPVRVQGFEMENVGMLWSVFINHVVRLIQVRGPPSPTPSTYTVRWLLCHDQYNGRLAQSGRPACAADTCERGDTCR